MVKGFKRTILNCKYILFQIRNVFYSLNCTSNLKGLYFHNSMTSVVEYQFLKIIQSVVNLYQFIEKKSTKGNDDS
jgi:hypothetical protein